jgi:hypothetical protein
MTVVKDKLNNLKQHIQAVVDETLPLIVFKPEDIIDLENHARPPFIGIAYLGMAPLGADSEGHRVQANYGVYIFGVSDSTDEKGKGDRKGCCSGFPVIRNNGQAVMVDLMDFLDEVRQAVGGKDDGSFQKWKFIKEQPHDFKKQGIGFLQLWGIPCNPF